MPAYALLVQPSSNRVYGRAAPSLLRAELEVVAASLDVEVHDVREEQIGGVPYVVFEADRLSDDAVGRLSDLSSTYALFERAADALRPVPVKRSDRFDDDLLTIQRYPGKTNESFTKLLVNVTAACSHRRRHEPSARLHLLDPLCGRGTSLNQALMYGWDATGIELDGRAVDAYETFIKTWLQDKRLKHRTESERIRRDGKIVGRRFDVTVGADKAEMQAGGIRLSVVHDDARCAADHVRRRSVDVVIADLPYGVQHASKGDGERRSARSPESLLDEALPAWMPLVRTGGAVGFAWNTRVLRRDALEELLDAHGLDVMRTEAFTRFAHRVDQSIQRDLIVARVRRQA